ncbi:2TM domain-containing protein [Ottowia sp. GY511]|uniref:2TM domain-containing protein n=1 Tax=Ottowia flava TaxID=2675430 RepID=A0ABW4KSQ8_9BURK|nr:2TM domain-containing protein [Ottowia sp. GY511]TXK33364.1 2TM domain-containing protein [Ottowia sp. GY511]
MTAATPSTRTTNPPLERLARRRAAAKLGWYTHALVYALVNVGLAAIALGNGQSWHAYPLLGWGLGLAIHGAAVWLLSPGARWREQLVERERQALMRQPR